MLVSTIVELVFQAEGAPDLFQLLEGLAAVVVPVAVAACVPAPIVVVVVAAAPVVDPAAAVVAVAGGPVTAVVTVAGGPGPGLGCRLLPPQSQLGETIDADALRAPHLRDLPVSHWSAVTVICSVNGLQMTQ